MVDVPSWSSRYRPSTPITWQGRRDGPGAVRYHEVVKIVDLRVSMPTFDPHDIILLGIAYDEGIRRNQGRVGAAWPLGKQISQNYPLGMTKMDALLP
jgi:hypothetical protein